MMPTTDTDTVEARVDLYLQEAGLSSRRPIIRWITGDASDRRYVRVVFPEGESLVLAVHSGPITFATLPFANVAALFESVPLPIPEIRGHSDALGIVSLQDLGDDTLQAYLVAANPDERRARYREAMTFIDRLQRRGAALTSDRYLPYGIVFDVPKLTWELDFFVKHFLVASRGAEITALEREALTAEWSAITSELASEARVICHRDFHSRNLMWHDGRLHVIDFQDARLGPDTYDLVSLLRDAYVEISDDELREHLDWFLALSGVQDTQEFHRRFDVMTVQRTFKALGTFGYQATARRNPVYLQYVPRTLAYARAALRRQSRFERLSEVLGRHVPELGSGYNAR